MRTREFCVAVHVITDLDVDEADVERLLRDAIEGRNHDIEVIEIEAEGLD